MAYAFVDLYTEVFNRGFQHLNDGGAGLARVKRWVNSAMHDIDDAEQWPYLTAQSTVGLIAPATIADLDGVERVEYSPPGGSPWVLDPSDRGSLEEQYGDLTITGDPIAFYILGGVTIYTYPVTSNPISVTYWKVASDLVADSDQPLMPDRYRDGIVEGACAKAYRDNDDPDMAAVCQAEMDRFVQRMREGYDLEPGPRTMTVYGYSQDW